MSLEKLKPSVSKYWLMVIAGGMWTVVGIMLCRLAYVWLKTVPGSRALTLGFFGLFFALAAHRYPFSKIASKNIDRLCLMADKCCIFAFQAWRSYLVVIFMMLLGISLRYSPFPKPYLAVIYAAIGGALFLSSFHFYRRVWMVKIMKRPCIPSDDKAPKV